LENYGAQFDSSALMIHGNLLPPLPGGKNVPYRYQYSSYLPNYTKSFPENYVIFIFTITMTSTHNVCTNVTLRHIHVTTVATEKQAVLHTSVYL
jgi:hypothetical protein